MTRGRPRRPLADRFWEKVDRRGDDECWPWKAAHLRDGYGRIAVGRRGSPMVSAHRVAWILAHGWIPAGMNVCHRCDNPPCVNHGHLFLETNLGNVKDKMQKGRNWTPASKTHCRHGHPFDAANTYIKPNGNRACRACKRYRARRATNVRREPEERRPA